MGKQSFWDKPIFHKLFGTTPGDGDIQPKEAVAYSIAGFGQNFICTIIGSYLTVFMTDALGFDLNATVFGASGVVAVAWLMLGTRIFDALNDPIMAASLTEPARSGANAALTSNGWQSLSPL